MSTHISSSTTDLARFVDEAKRHGLPDDALVPLLRQNGWSERRVYETLGLLRSAPGDVPAQPQRARGERARRVLLFVELHHAGVLDDGAGPSLLHLDRSLVSGYYRIFVRGLADRSDRLATRNGGGGVPDLLNHQWTYRTQPATAAGSAGVGCAFVADLYRAGRRCAGSAGRRHLVRGRCCAGILRSASCRISWSSLVLGGGVFTYYLAGLRRAPEGEAA